jgi:hypothetical protein
MTADKNRQFPDRLAKSLEGLENATAALNQFVQRHQLGRRIMPPFEEATPN